LLTLGCSPSNCAGPQVTGQVRQLFGQRGGLN